MNPSYVSAVVAILVMVLPAFGLHAPTEQLTQIIQALFIVITGIVTIVHQVRSGQATTLGRAR